MFKKSLLVTSFLFSLTLTSYGAEAERMQDPFASAYAALREAGLEGDDLIAQLSFMFGPIKADVVEKKLPDISSTTDSSSTSKKGEPEYREIDHLKVHNAFDGQTKYLDPMDFVGEMLSDRLGINNVTVRESSFKNFDCFFFSIIGENKQLLTQVLEGNEALAEKLLSVPEYAGRDFTPVRRAFFDAILRNLELQIQRKEHLPISIEELIRDIIGGDRELRDSFISQGKAYNSSAIDIGAYFDYLCNQHIYLDDTFAVIFSYIYDVPVYVLNPCTEINFETLILQSQTTAYYLLPQTKEPVFIYHLGFFGGHYWKLRFPTGIEWKKVGSLPTTSSAVETSAQEAAASSVLTSSMPSSVSSDKASSQGAPTVESAHTSLAPSSVSASSQAIKAPSISLLTQEVPLDSSKLNGQKLVLKLTKAVSSKEAQRLAKSATEALEAHNAHIARLENIRKHQGYSKQEFEASLGAMFGFEEKDLQSIYDPNNEVILAWLMSMDTTTKL